MTKPVEEYELVREVLSDIAPDELEFAGDIELASSAAAMRDAEPALAFGVDVPTSGMVVATLAAVTQVYHELGEALVKEGVKAVAAGVVERLKQLLGATNAPAKALSPQQMLEIRSGAFKAAMKSGLEKGKAEQIADALVVRLLQRAASS